MASESRTNGSRSNRPTFFELAGTTLAVKQQGFLIGESRPVGARAVPAVFLGSHRYCPCCAPPEDGRRSDLSETGPLGK